MNLKDTYNKIAEDWVKDHSSDTWWVEGTNKFVLFLKPGDSVLDVGCGPGVKSKYLFDKGFDVFGVDLSEKMVEIAQREVSKATFLVADIKNLGGVQQLFEGVFAQAVLLHIPKLDVPIVISELKSKLKTRGYLYIAVKERLLDGKEEEIVTENDYGYEYERFFSYFTLAEIQKYLIDSQMEICYENIASSGKTNWIQVIAQKIS